MMVSKRKTQIAVDEKFFRTIFEQQRREVQKKLGVMNLSQANFSKMIVGLKIRKFRLEPLKINKNKRGRRNESFI